MIHKDYLEGGLVDQLCLCVEQLLGNDTTDDNIVRDAIHHLKTARCPVGGIALRMMVLCGYSNMELPTRQL